MRVLIADDHSIVRSGLRYLAGDLGEGVDVTEAGSYQSLLAALEAGDRPDLVIADLWMPGYAGPGDMASVCRKAAPAPVAVFSMSADPDEARAVLAGGARAFIPKSTDDEQVVGILRLILSGGTYVPPHLALAGGAPPAGGGFDLLSRRQRDVLELLAVGLSNKEIGERLGLELATVKSHLAAIFRILDVESRTQAVLAVKSYGRLPGPPLAG